MRALKRQCKEVTELDDRLDVVGKGRTDVKAAIQACREEHSFAHRHRMRGELVAL